MSWKSFLKKTLNENIEKVGMSATYASLATVKADRTPAVRTVVVRGFLAEHHKEITGYTSDLLIITTDKRSRKIQEIETNPNTEICWYMNGDMSQFRIQGTLYPVFRGSSPLSWANSVCQQTTTSSEKSLAQQAFERQMKIDPWEAERLRQFILFDPKLRAEMAEQTQYETLEIVDIDEKGWFKHHIYQAYLEEAYTNFVVLLVQVKSVGYWSPSAGLKQLL
ncbi:pyridoxamine 5'-phosphate oxidase-domain-containing protein [Sporodiniella umbellata]|nr:pyridoxamine 5'-phosphate oxidase-domain-containing protein [Sporodiniella umbellata]